MRTDADRHQPLPGLPRDLAVVPTTALTRDGGFRTAPDGPSGPSASGRGKAADARTACVCPAGTHSVREFPQFEHGAGV